MNTMRCAIYARVSTIDRGQDTENQLVELRRFAESQSWELGPVYQDAVSGSKGRDKRPAFDRMLNDASQRRFDILLVWAVDRLSRQGPYACLEVLKTLTGYGVKFRSFQQPFLDTVSGFGEVLLALFGWLASEERRLISERTKAGLSRARRNGKVLGRRAVSVDISRVRSLRAQGASIRAIARETGCSIGTIHNLCSTNVPETHAASGAFSATV